MEELKDIWNDLSRKWLDRKWYSGKSRGRRSYAPIIALFSVIGLISGLVIYALKTTGGKDYEYILNNAKKMYSTDVHLFEPFAWEKEEYRTKSIAFSTQEREEGRFSLRTIPYKPDFGAIENLREALPSETVSSQAITLILMKDLFGRMDTLLKTAGTECICPKMIGIRRRLMVVKSEEGLNGYSTNKHLVNCEVVSDKDNEDSTQTIVTEAHSVLFPNQKPSRVIRDNSYALRCWAINDDAQETGKREEWVKTLFRFKGKTSWCVQFCMDLDNGIVSWDKSL